MSDNELCRKHEARLAMLQEHNEHQDHLIRSACDKIDTVMEHVLVIKSEVAGWKGEMANGLTTRIMRVVEGEMSRQRKRIGLMISLGVAIIAVIELIAGLGVL